jgi:hypothetical protein
MAAAAGGFFISLLHLSVKPVAALSTRNQYRIVAEAKEFHTKAAELMHQKRGEAPGYSPCKTFLNLPSGYRPHE